jgi:hypothetical protein
MEDPDKKVDWLKSSLSASSHYDMVAAEDKL